VESEVIEKQPTVNKPEKEVPEPYYSTGVQIPPPPLDQQLPDPSVGPPSGPQAAPGMMPMMPGGMMMRPMMAGGMVGMGGQPMMYYPQGGPMVLQKPPQLAPTVTVIQRAPNQNPIPTPFALSPLQRPAATHKPKVYYRKAAGKQWEDASLAEWDPNDFRIFVGDLGNEVNDDMLKNCFSKFKSFTKAKVIRDARTGKTKGYGFASFYDARDYVEALRTMNGKYIGNRPIKLRKSTWKSFNDTSKMRQKNSKNNKRQKKSRRKKKKA